MRFINFYIISTIICILIVFLNNIAMRRQLKKEGYKIKELREVNGVYRKKIIKRTLFLLIPFFNIVVALGAMIFFDKALKEVIRKIEAKRILEAAIKGIAEGLKSISPTLKNMNDSLESEFKMTAGQDHEEKTL